MMLRQPRLDMGYGLVDLMDAARDAAERVHVPYLMLHGLGDRIVPTEPVRAAIEVMPPRRDSKLAFYHERLSPAAARQGRAGRRRRHRRLDLRPRGRAAVGRRGGTLATGARRVMGVEAKPLTSSVRCRSE